jgi:hypothetical protein
MYSSMKFQNSKPIYDEMNEKFFNDQLQKKTKAQKEVDMDSHLKRFTENKEILEIENILKMKKDEEEKRKKRDDKIHLEQNQAMRNHTFLQTFEQKGIDNWKKNMVNKKEREKKDLDFEYKEAIKFHNKVYTTIENNKINTIRKIDEFESKLQKMALDNQNDYSNDNNMTNKNSRSYTFTDTLKNKITDKLMKNANVKRERDRRRRKIIVEQSKAQLEIENKRREFQYISKLDKKSNQEKQLYYEDYRIIQPKNIIGENRKLRSEMYDERKEMDKNFLEKNEEEMLNLHKDIYERDLEREEFRKKELEIANKQKKRSNNTENCRKIVELIVDIAEV